MKPFDLEAAKRGDKVVTKKGLPVRVLCYDADISRDGHKYPIAVIIGAGSGAYIAAVDVHGLDNGAEQLYMAPKKVKRWVATACFNHELGARHFASRYDDGFVTVEEIEVEE